MKQSDYSCKARIILSVLIGLFISVNMYAQNVTINGNVKDATGEPVIGASVVEKGTTNGTITDFDGNFTLTMPRDGVLSISYIGYKTQEVTYQNQSNLIIILQEDSEMLDEVVVIGYGTVRKDDATGSVTAIKPDKMNKGLTTNAQDMMTGKIAGVSVISEGGAPGSGAQIRIRGGASLSASNDPLIVIDGLAMDNEGIKGLSNPLSMVNPNDIETFTVLKDASATAIYGSRASNGVIIITTKKGAAGSRPRVTYDGNVSVSTARKTYDVLSGDEFRAYASEVFAGQDELLSELGTENTDWQKEVFRNSVSTDHNITVSGGLKNMPYRASVGYTNQNGILKTSHFERYTVAASVNPSFFDNHLKFNINAKVMVAKNRYADTGAAVGGALGMDPTRPVRSDEDVYQKYFGGYFQWYQNTSDVADETWQITPNKFAGKNPVAALNQKDDNATSHSYIGNIEIDYKFHFLPDLRAHVNMGADLSDGKQITDISRYSATNNYYGYYKTDKIDKYNLSFNAFLQYTKDFDWSMLDVIGGYEWQHFHRKGDENSYGLYPSTHEQAGEYFSPEAKIWKTESYLVSFFGRVNYSLFNKYLFTATLRDDGTSRFHKDHRWGLFPSAAFAWKMKEENFLSDIDVLSDMKLRLGYGITGQQNLMQGDYPYLPTYTQNLDYAYYKFGDEYVITYRPDAYNKNLKWEETTTYNAGIDFGFLNGRITGSADYYFRKTKDLINMVDVPAGTNFKNRVISNIGSMENQGFEFSINAKPITNRDFTWDVGYNITFNDSKITKLTTGTGDGYYVATGGISPGIGANIQAHMVDYAPSSFFVYQQVYDENGKPIENTFVDRNGDGIINNEDRYIYKKPTADVLMGFTSKMIYKQFDFSFSLRASLGNYVYNDVLARSANTSATGIHGSEWSNVLKPALALGFSGREEYFFSDYFVQNASFLRMDNVTLGYSFPKLLGEDISGRIYATVQNPFVITKYKGLDPELKDGIDKDIYPRPVICLLGVSLAF